jgi:hypothetical protein
MHGQKYVLKGMHLTRTMAVQVSGVGEANSRGAWLAEGIRVHAKDRHQLTTSSLSPSLASYIHSYIGISDTDGVVSRGCQRDMVTSADDPRADVRDHPQQQNVSFPLSSTEYTVERR